jgi:hypothetical protein
VTVSSRQTDWQLFARFSGMQHWSRQDSMKMCLACVIMDHGYIGGLKWLTQLGRIEVLDVVLAECHHPKQPGLVEQAKAAGIMRARRWRGSATGTTGTPARFRTIWRRIHRQIQIKGFDFVNSTQGGDNVLIYGLPTTIKDHGMLDKPGQGNNIYRVSFDGQSMNLIENVAETTGLGLGVHTTIYPDASGFAAADGLSFGATPEQMKFAISKLPGVKAVTGPTTVTSTRQTITALLGGLLGFAAMMIVGSLILVSLCAPDGIVCKRRACARTVPCKLA